MTPSAGNFNNPWSIHSLLVLSFARPSRGLLVSSSFGSPISVTEIWWMCAAGHTVSTCGLYLYQNTTECIDFSSVTRLKMRLSTYISTHLLVSPHLAHFLHGVAAVLVDSQLAIQCLNLPYALHLLEIYDFALPCNYGLGLVSRLCK